VRGNTAHLYPKDIADLPVPIFTDALLERVSAGFRDAYLAEREAHQKLRQAVEAVETFVLTT
jgi:hypothetical protein